MCTISPATNFKMGDLVWANIKGAPLWPGKIQESTGVLEAPSSNHYNVFLFGSYTHRWVHENSLRHHNEAFIKAKRYELAGDAYGLAIEEIQKESLMCAQASTSRQNEEEEQLVMKRGKSDPLNKNKGNKQGKKITRAQMQKGQCKGKETALVIESGEENDTVEQKGKAADARKHKLNETDGKKDNADKQKESDKEKHKGIGTKAEKQKDREMSLVKMNDTVIDNRKGNETEQEKSSENKTNEQKQKKSDTGKNIVPKRVYCGSFEDFVFNGIGSRNYCGPNVANEYVQLPAPVPLVISTKNPNIMAKCIIPTKKKIGLIGLGVVGCCILKNLLHTGHDVTILTQPVPRCKEFVKHGAKQVKSPADVFRNCDITFCCLSDPEHAKKIFYGKDVLKAFSNGTCENKGYVEMTVMDPNKIIEMGKEVKKFGGRYLEAMFRGSRELADTGSLVIACSGDQSLFDDCKSCFEAISKGARFAGTKLGDGSKMNLILNTIEGVSVMALAESIALMERSKIESGQFMKIIENYPMKLHPRMTELAKRMMNKDYAPDITLKRQHEMIKLVLKMAGTDHQPLVTIAQSNEAMKKAQLLGYKSHDVTSVVQSMRFP